jgi:hypothetical protein
MEEEYAEKLHQLFRDFKNEFDESMIVFTISNIDLKNKSVFGTLISEIKLRKGKAPLPSIIFNFSLQRDDQGIKARKALEEMPEVTFINYINKFDQWMIMDIISSSNKVKKYLLPYYIYDKSERNFRPEDDKKYITMPSRGASLDRVIFAEPDPDTDIIRGTQYFKKGHISDYIDASLCQQRWLFIEVPDLVLRNSNPVVVRIYMQKTTTKTWIVLDKNINPRIDEKEIPIQDGIEKVALSIIEEINKFLPSLGHCFIDFILSSKGKPYFLHLGGLDRYFLKQETEKHVYKKLYRNLLSLSRSYRAT